MAFDEHRFHRDALLGRLGAASPGSCWAAIPRRRSARVPRRMN